MAGPVALVILDGWGISPERSPSADATRLAKTPVFDRLFARYPTAELLACGEAVGLPDGVIGNSEVGHLNIGAGRVVYQSLTRISRSIQDESFFANEALVDLCSRVRERGGRLHLIGLCSDAGVHAHVHHLTALLELAKRQGIADVRIHAITDGRDTPPTSGAEFLAAIAARAEAIGVGRLTSVIGRYLVMDRDRRWERTQQGYEAAFLAAAPRVDDLVAHVRGGYANGIYDEFCPPACAPFADPVTADDGVVFFNFRADRARQLTEALTAPDFDGFSQPASHPLIDLVTLTQYAGEQTAPAAFPPIRMSDLLGSVVSAAGKTQLRVAETEKYAHVTYFFNGGEEAPSGGEERLLVASDRSVPTYDLVPAMRAAELTERTLARLACDPPIDLLVINYANPDMVGHTGNLAAVVKAVEAVDRSLGRLLAGIEALGGVALVTADHGNAECMRHPGTGGPHTAHTLNPVPIALFDPARRRTHRLRAPEERAGALCDLAPTLLELLEIAAPKAMTGQSLLAPR